MTPNLLILGGTTEATRLARAVSEAGLKAVVSLAGRVERPARQPLPLRIGGFGGIDGLSRYLTDNSVTHLVDATHPFAAQMSRNAIAAAARVNVPVAALTRPAWAPQPGDDWQHVDSIEGAVGALDRPAARVMLAVGRMHLEAFAPNPQHFYLLRLVDPPAQKLPFPQAEVVVSRGPFTEEDDRRLMQKHGIDLVVSKNSGGTGAYAKIAAARSLGLPVLMIGRPDLPERRELVSPQQVLDWVAHSGTDLGV